MRRVSTPLAAFLLIALGLLACQQTALDGLDPTNASSFTLIDAQSDQPVAGFDPIMQGATLELSALPTRQLNVRANIASTGSVRFTLNGEDVRTENDAPYALAGDTAGDYMDWTPEPGSYELTATPYSSENGGGEAGAPQKLSFEVVEAGAPPDPNPGQPGEPAPTPEPSPVPEGCSVVALEAESLPLTGAWQVVDDGAASGGAYVTWLGLSKEANNEQPADIVDVALEIQQAGSYRFTWAMRQPDDVAGDKANDSWVNFPDAARFGPVGGGSYGGFIKVFGNGKGSFNYGATADQNHQKSELAIDFSEPGTYRMQLAGRSHGHQIDRIVIYHDSVSQEDAIRNRCADSPSGPTEPSDPVGSPEPGSFPQMDTWYTLENVQQGGLLSTDAESGLFLEAERRDDNSYFKFVPAGSGSYLIVNKLPGRGALDTRPDGDVRWTVEAAPDGADKRWTVVQEGNGYRFDNVEAGRGFLVAKSGEIAWNTGQRDDASLWRPTAAGEASPDPQPDPQPEPGNLGPELDYDCERIAWSSDGNQHDPDDIGASALALLLLAERGQQGRLAHWDHSSHLGDNNPSMEQQMVESVEETARRIGYDMSRIYNDQRDLSGSVNSIAQAINASSATNRLCFVVAGPHGVAYRGIAQADPSKFQHVTMISHSNWNDTHDDADNIYNLADIKRDFPGLNFQAIRDQNGTNGLGTSVGEEAWAWMKSSSDAGTRWVGEVIDNANIRGDVSDSGMMWYVLQGDEFGNPTKFRDYLE